MDKIEENCQYKFSTQPIGTALTKGNIQEISEEVDFGKNLTEPELIETYKKYTNNVKQNTLDYDDSQLAEDVEWYTCIDLGTGWELNIAKTKKKINYVKVPLDDFLSLTGTAGYDELWTLKKLIRNAVEEYPEWIEKNPSPELLDLYEELGIVKEVKQKEVEDEK